LTPIESYDKHQNPNTTLFIMMELYQHPWHLPIILIVQGFRISQQNVIWSINV